MDKSASRDVKPSFVVLLVWHTGALGSRYAACISCGSLHKAHPQGVSSHKTWGGNAVGMPAGPSLRKSRTRIVVRGFAITTEKNSNLCASVTQSPCRPKRDEQASRHGQILQPRICCEPCSVPKIQFCLLHGEFRALNLGLTIGGACRSPCHGFHRLRRQPSQLESPPSDVSSASCVPVDQDSALLVSWTWRTTVAGRV